MVPLESSKLFSSLSGQELTRLIEVAREIRFAPKQQIFQEGDKGDGLYVVKQGAVLVSSSLADEERKILSRLGPGELFGEMAVLDDEPRSATVTAELDTVVYFIPREELLQMLEHNPSLAIKLVREISRRLREFNRHYIQEVLQGERMALVGRFASSIIHDLKNPLNIIGLSAEIAGMDTANLEMRVMAKDRIGKQVERISNLVNELLQFTRSSETSLVLGATAYDLFVQHLLPELRAEAALKSVCIECENEPPSLQVQIDPPRLARVFHNLIHNATDAMPQGGKIVLRFEVKGAELVTEVEDTGAGIAPEIANRIFQAFASYGKVHGTGLGLSICKRIVEDHGGKIYARNEAGRGAILAFTLPLHKA
jgi:signal transduction histidine kinase